MSKALEESIVKWKARRYGGIYGGFEMITETHGGGKAVEFELVNDNKSAIVAHLGRLRLEHPGLRVVEAGINRNSRHFIRGEYVEADKVALRYQAVSFERRVELMAGAWPRDEVEGMYVEDGFVE